MVDRALQELGCDVQYILGSKNELVNAMSLLCPNLTPIPSENKHIPSCSNEEDRNNFVALTLTTRKIRE